MMFSLFGKLASFSIISYGALGPTGTHTTRAFVASFAAAISVLSGLNGKPSVTTTTTELASSRPFIYSCSASPSATDVSVVAAGNLRAPTSLAAFKVLFVKRVTQTMPQSFTRSGAAPLPVHLS